MTTMTIRVTVEDQSNISAEFRIVPTPTGYSVYQVTMVKGKREQQLIEVVSGLDSAMNYIRSMIEMEGIWSSHA